MTELELRQKYVATAKVYYGVKEGSAAHRQIVDTYNSHTPLARGYKLQYTDAWCSGFVSAISILCGFTDIIPTEVGCGAHIELFRKMGRWVEADDYVPTMGDLVLYYWKDNGKGDCTGYPDHIGIVVSVSNGSILVIEGNMDDGVGYRNVPIDGKYIRGFCIPDYAKKASEATAGWKYDKNGWWYQYEDGSWPKNQWAIIDEVWYRFDANGYMLAGCDVEVDGKIYTLDEKGKTVSVREKEEDTMGKYFKDVADDRWSAEAIGYCKENGLMIGVGNEEFQPDRAVTREELAQALSNLHKAVAAK